MLTYTKARSGLIIGDGYRRFGIKFPNKINLFSKAEAAFSDIPNRSNKGCYRATSRFREPIKNGPAGHITRSARQTL